MVYNQKLVACIKCNGKVLREFNDTVYLPFGNEFSILLKNLNSVKALVNVTIDGKDIVPGGLVLYPNQEIDLERSIENGNMNKGAKFLFVERTGSIEDNRGVKAEDGLVRISYQFEKIAYINGFYTDGRLTTGISYDGFAKSYYGAGAGNVPVMDSCTISCNNLSITPTSVNVNQQSLLRSSPVNEVGITVPGSESNQKFQVASNFSLEAQTHVIVLKLLGETKNNRPVIESVTVKTKQECPTCGRKNKATAKFCQECGTSLVVY